MPRKLTLLLTLLLCSLGSQLVVRKAVATTPLTYAVIQLLRNEVELLPEGELARPAAISDEMVPGDALATSREAFAELFFNDGSLARVGERVLFRFVPETRTFRLDNGTVLLLIPPGQGRTRLRTPNATAGIRGSALFVRYNEETDTTLIGALTDSGIEAYNHDETERYELESGQMAVVVDNHIQQIYQFDLERFYETSELTRGLNLESPEYFANQGQLETTLEPESLTLVRSETLTALEEYKFDDSGVVLEMPDFVRMSATLEDLRDVGLGANFSAQSPGNDRAGDRPSSQFDRVLDVTEVQNDPIGRSSPDPLDRQPTPGNRRPDVNDRRPEPDNRRPDVDDRRPEPDNRQPDVDDRRPEPDNRQPDVDDRQPDVDDRRPEPDNRQPDVDDRQPDVDDREPDVDDRQPDNDRDPRGPEEGDIDVEAGEG
ncbi:MAG: iron dicitrate transport regulator FecR [Cyanobacteria bacterium P01_E01_bin.6]